MVAVAQVVEHWIVAPVVAGSTPVSHPKVWTPPIPLRRRVSSRLDCGGKEDAGVVVV
jgi:hypothetical protein